MSEGNGIPEGDLSRHMDTQDGTVADATPAPGTSAADQAAIAAADRGLNTDSNNDNSPELLAGKYKDEAALNKGVTELLKMQYPDMSVADIYKGLETGKLVPSSTAAANDQAGDKGEAGQSNDAGKDQDLTSNLDPLDPVALTLERDANDGNLTPETREKLIKEHNIPEGTIDAYLAGLSAIEEKFVGEVYDLAGGEEDYNAMLDWMNTSVPEAELTAFNDQLSTQDIDKVKMAVNGMQARYKAVVGDNPNLLRPNGGDNQNVITGAYASKAEWMQDMAKPEYKTNPAFREQVMAKLAKSNL